MKQMPRLVSSGVVLVAMAVSACGKEKADALAEIDKIKSACQTGDREKASNIMLAAADNNETFSKSLRDVTANVPDKSVLDACGTLTDRVKKHLEEH